jgi:O-antigen/teichoic acid export membrane protein
LKELLRFGLPYVPSGLAVLIMDLIGRFFLDRMLGKEPTGIFSAGYKLGMIMALVVAAFRFAWHPFFLSTSKEKNAQEVFGRVFTYFLLVTGGFFLLISFFIHEIVRFELFGKAIVGPAYAEGAVIVPVVMLAYIGYGVYANFVVGIYLKKKTAYLPFITGVGALISLLANRFLIPPLGIMGAAWAVLFAYTAMAVTLYLVSRRLYPIPYEGVRILKLILVAGLLFFIGTQTDMASSILVRTGLFILYIPLLWCIRFFQPDEIRSLKKLAGRIRS